VERQLTDEGLRERAPDLEAGEDFVISEAGAVEEAILLENGQTDGRRTQQRSAGTLTGFEVLAGSAAGALAGLNIETNAGDARFYTNVKTAGEV